MKTLVSIIVFMFSVSLAHAQWNTNWPSWQWPRDLDAQVRQCNSALVERVGVCLTAPPTTVSANSYRTYREWVGQQKFLIKTLIPQFVSTNQAGADGTYTNYFATSAPGTAFPMLSVTGLLWDCYLPTNYLEMTPYRGLSGLGGMTNDATVGHPYMPTGSMEHAVYTEPRPYHGWFWVYSKVEFNAAQAGTNYPPGRTNWYNSDYGIDGLQKILRRLSWTGQLISQSDITQSSGPGHYWGAYSNAVGSATGPFTNYVSVQQQALTNCQTNAYVRAWEYYDDAYMVYDSWYPVFRGTMYTATYDNNLVAVMYNPLTSFYAGIKTNILRDMQVYIRTDVHNNDDPYDTLYDQDNTYDSCGMPVESNKFTLALATSATNTAWHSDMWGDTNAPDYWGATNLVIAGKYTTHGFCIRESRLICKWDGTNGFTYK